MELAFPKPKAARKTKKVNGWKDKPKRICYYCGTNGAERHEIYGGPNRQISINHGFQLDLCPSCHKNFHNPPDSAWKDRIGYWKRRYQKLYEQELINAGIKEDQAREIWIKLIGRSYL